MFELFKRQTPEDQIRERRLEHKQAIEDAMNAASLPELYPGQYSREDAVDAIESYLGKGALEKKENVRVREKLDAAVAKSVLWLKDNAWRGQI